MTDPTSHPSNPLFEDAAAAAGPVAIDPNAELNAIGPDAAEADGASPRRRPELGGYARGEETRARIIVAALHVFGEVGYTRASTRRISADAGVNPPALQYYFDSKEGLHRACAEYIVDRFTQLLAPSLTRAESVLQSSDPGAALDMICDFLDVVVDASLSPEAVNWKRFMARAQADGAGPAYPLIRDRISTPVHAALARLVALVTGANAGDEGVRLRAAVVMGQISAFNAYRESTLRNLSWPDFDGDRLVLIKATLRLHTRAALSAASPAPSN